MAENGQSSSVGMTVREAADYAKVHPQTIRNWIKEGKLACERHGPSGWNISIKKEDLDGAITKH